MADRFFQTGQGRVWLQKFGPRPDRSYDMLGCARMGGVTLAEGDITRVRCPDPNAYNQFIDVGEIRGAPELPTTSLIARLGLVNYILQLKCAFDLQVLYGNCKHPGDRIRGWEKILHFNGSRFTQRASEDLTAMTDEEQNPILLTGDVTASLFQEIDPLTFSASGAFDVTTQILDLVVCDQVSCGDCEQPSEGCEKIYAISQAPGAGSPAIKPEVVYSEDGGLNWLNQYIDSLAASEQPSGAACVAGYLVVISNGSCSLHYAELTDLDTWTEQATGFVATKCPNGIYAPDPAHVFMVGDGGYVYLAEDVTAAVVVLEAGVVTTQILNAIHGIGNQFLVAVGAGNAVIYSDDGGATWQSVTGPVVGNNLISLWCVSEDVWFVGTDNIGKLYYTLDRGQTWAEKVHPDSATGGDVKKIVFTSDPAVGFFLFNTMTPAGRIYRTIDGGNSWYRLPEQQGISLPANDALNGIAVCGPNEVWVGGLGDNAADGIILHGVGYE